MVQSWTCIAIVPGAIHDDASRLLFENRSFCVRNRGTGKDLQQQRASLHEDCIVVGDRWGAVSKLKPNQVHIFSRALHDRLIWPVRLPNYCHISTLRPCQSRPLDIVQKGSECMPIPCTNVLAVCQLTWLMVAKCKIGTWNTSSVACWTVEVTGGQACSVTGCVIRKRSL